VLSALVRGWFVAGCLDHLDLADDGVSIYVPAPVGRGGKMIGFPWPTLSAVKVTGPDLMPALLESVSLAMLEVNTSESLDPMRPYDRLHDLGSGPTDEVPDELAAWVINGKSAKPGLASPLDWELRRAAVVQRLDSLSTRYAEYFEKVSERTELLDFPGSYELRGQIRGSLGDLRRAVAALQPAVDGGGWV